MADGRKFRIDAANLSTLSAREFVHSLSASYLQKHITLTGAGWNVLWILDGAKFASLRVRERQDGSLDCLLKPRAYELATSLKCLGAKVRVHFQGMLWGEWKRNRWYRRDGMPSLTYINAAIERFITKQNWSK